MIKTTGILVLACLVSFSMTAAALADTGDKPRLKFRSKGSVCSCTSDLGDKEIQKALEARFSRLDSIDSISGERRELDEEQRRVVNEK